MGSIWKALEGVIVAPIRPVKRVELAGSLRYCLSRQNDPGVAEAEQLAQYRYHSERDCKVPRPAGAVTDECILDVFERAENTTQQVGNLPARQIIDATAHKQPVGAFHFIGGEFFLTCASYPKSCAKSEIAG